MGPWGPFGGILGACGNFLLSYFYQFYLLFEVRVVYFPRALFFNDDDWCL